VKYRVYTDGACDHVSGNASTAYVVLTDELFIGMGGQLIRSKNIAMAETTAIALAFAFIKERVGLNKEDEIEVYSDSEAAITFCKSLLERKTEVRHTNKMLEAIHKDLLTTNSQCKLSIRKVRAHKANMNPNKLADRIAKFLLRSGVTCLQ
jgi:ribonuclease HI